LVVFIALAGCTNTSAADPAVSSAADSEGSSALFCRGWDEARHTIVDTINGEESRLDWYDSAKALDRAMSEYNEYAPPDIRSEWATAYDVYTKLSDIRFTTGGATRTEHMTMVFGSAGAEPALTRAMTAIALIDEWSLTQCGDFCSRWPTLQHVILSEPWIGVDGDEREVQRHIDNVRAAIRGGYLLVPEDIKSQWARAADLTVAILDMYEAYDMHLPEGDQNEEGDDIFVEWLGMQAERVTVVSIAAMGAIDVWVADNCDAASMIGGAPGSLRIRYWPYEHVSGRTVFAALLPAGLSFESVVSADQYLGVSCGQLFEPAKWLDEVLADLTRRARESNLLIEDLIEEQWQWGDSVRALRPPGEYYESICGRLRHETDLVLPGGQYELFVGTFIGDPGSYGLYLGAPEYCAQVTVNIDGDTIVNVPELKKCTIPPRGVPAEIVRHEVAPFEPGGTLSVELESPTAPAEFEECGLTAVLLPSGTTLNDVGLGNTWPVGGFRAGLGNAAWIEQSLAPGTSIQVGRVPIVGVGPTGGVAWLPMQPDRQSGLWDTFLPDPVPLAAGVYDLRLEEECYTSQHDEEGENHRRCGALIAVEVDGDTVVGVPPLGDCP
jgi:hypothetical protein